MPPPPTIQIGLTIGIVDQPNDIVHKWIFIFLNCELEGLVTVGLETQRARPGGVPDASFSSMHTRTIPYMNTTPHENNKKDKEF